MLFTFVYQMFLSWQALDARMLSKSRSISLSLVKQDSGHSEDSGVDVHTPKSAGPASKVPSTVGLFGPSGGRGISGDSQVGVICYYNLLCRRKLDLDNFCCGP